MTDISNFELFQKLNTFSRYTHRHHFGPGEMPPGPPMRPPMDPPCEEPPFCPPHRGHDRPHGIPFGMGPNPHFDHPRGERPPFPPCGPEGPHHRPPKRPPLSREHLLVIISRNPEGIRQKQIAEIAGINQSSTSELISKLENDGYVKRTVDPSDKRATLLFLTELGQARAAEVEDERDAAFEDFFRVLTPEEKQAFSDILDKLIAAQEMKDSPEERI